jgi:hypothetical protein
MMGCGKKSPRPIAWAGAVQGRVYLDGKPISSGTITFLPDDGEEGRPGLARIEPDGTFAVCNANEKEPKGLQPGRYRVTVLQMIPNPTGTGRPIAVMGAPAHYADYLATPLRAVVKPGDNRLEFQLDSAGAPTARVAAHE